MSSSPLSETKEAAGTIHREREALQHSSRPPLRRYFGGILNSDAGAGAGITPHPDRRTPDHPPYSEMVEVALRTLAEDDGSTESSISAYIQSRFTDLPWGHDRLLPYYLSKLVVAGEVISPSPDRYQVRPTLSSTPSTLRRRGRPRLHPLNPNNRFSSSPPRCREISRPYRRRGRRPKTIAEGMPPLHEEKKILPLRRRRGRPPLRRDHAMAGIDMNIEGSDIAVLPDPNSFVALEQFSPGKEPPFLAPETSEGNGGGQLGILALDDDKKNEGSESFSLEDSEQAEQGKGQSLMGEGPSFVAPEEPLLLTPDLGKVLPSLTPEQTEVIQDQSFQGEGLPLLPEKEPSFLASKHFKRCKRQRPQRKTPTSVPPEQIELNQEQSLLEEGPPLLFPEKPGDGHGLSLVPQASEDGHEERSQGEGTTMVVPMEGELVLTEEVQNTAVLSKKRSHGEGTTMVVPMEGELVLTEEVQNTAVLSKKKSREEGTTMVVPMGGELVLTEEVQNTAVLSKKMSQGEGTTMVVPMEGELVLTEEVQNTAVLSKKRSQGEGTTMEVPMEGELVLTEEVQNTAVLSKKRRQQPKQKKRRQQPKQKKRRQQIKQRLSQGEEGAALVAPMEGELVLAEEVQNATVFSKKRIQQPKPLSQEEGAALVAPLEGELVLTGEVQNAAVFSKKRKQPPKRRLSQGEGMGLVAPMDGGFVLAEEVQNASDFSKKRRQQPKRGVSNVAQHQVDEAASQVKTKRRPFTRSQGTPKLG